MNCYIVLFSLFKIVRLWNSTINYIDIHLLVDISSGEVFTSLNLLHIEHDASLGLQKEASLVYLQWYLSLAGW